MSHKFDLNIVFKKIQYSQQAFIYINRLLSFDIYHDKLNKFPMTHYDYDRLVRETFTKKIHIYLKNDFLDIIVEQMNKHPEFYLRWQSLL